MGEFAFDADSRVVAADSEGALAGVFAAELTDRWNRTAGAVTGGYMLACRAITRFVSGGYHEEDFEIWDSTGTLVAQSRQLALVVPR